MRHAGRLGMAAAFALAGAFAIGCQNGVSGPSLSATLQNVRLNPTVAGVEAGENVCCCHVLGTITNTSSITAHVQVVFTAKNKSGTVVGMASVLERDIASRASRSFEASGIQAACKDLDINQIVADQRVSVTGLWEPR